VSEPEQPILNDAPGESAAQASPQLPPPPRTVSPFVLRQSLRDPRVRFSRLVSIFMAVAGLVLGIIGWRSWATESRITRDGVRVDARVYEFGGHLGTMVIPADSEIKLLFELDGKQYTNRGRLPPRDENLRNGDTIPIMVDRENPQLWTSQLRPPSLVKEMLGPILLFPSALIALVVSALLRRRVLALWKHGQPELASVLDAKQTALAPRSWFVRCARADRSIVAVYVPRRFGKLEPGQPIWLLAWPRPSQGALAAMVYQEETMSHR